MQSCWRSDKVEFCEINKRNAGMQRSTISMFAQLVQLMGGKIEFHQGLRMNVFVSVANASRAAVGDCSLAMIRFTLLASLPVSVSSSF